MAKVHLRPRRCCCLIIVVLLVLLMMKSMLFTYDLGTEDKQRKSWRDEFRNEQYPNRNHEGAGMNQGDGKFKETGAVLKDTIGNYEPPPQPPREGPGENGVPVKTRPEEKPMVEQKIKEYGFNQYVSDLISLDRNIPDLRNEQCKYWHYPEKLPTTSVILVFHNEGWSTLLRNVHSIMNRTPPQLLHEIILVDDFSTKDHLKRRLQDYISLPKFQNKVKIIRNERREGLIRTRINGAKYATGEVLLWLDAHCEVGHNWLPPLLTPIAQNRTTVVNPIIDVIDNQDFKFYAQGSGEPDRGGFDWSLYWKHFNLPDFEKKRRRYSTEPWRSPAMAGGLFAMDRKYFFELGAYDEGLEIWGGENFELSFKIWMCGGSLLWVPCSRVGHIYRIMGRVPYSAPNGSMLVIGERNLRRVVDVWFDDYAKYFYRSKPEALMVDPGDLSKQLNFRRTHDCKDFDWFMKEIAPDIPLKFPLPSANIKWGEVRPLSSRLCVDSMGKRDGGRIGMSSCHGAGGNQLLRVTEDGQFRLHDQCAYEKSGEVHLRRCEQHTKYSWKFLENTNQLTLQDKNLCLDHSPSKHDLFMSRCKSNVDTQRWEISSKNLQHH
ncbi:N-acetylgalactosaminyltransferase 7-like [Anneissia japonica]|uniref:N-acetylgalactosaminyltransferase 7-like n=1 Tax=Anneissia japonica TaxID=1529436 RepID=UPI001425A884|nr:N-acetylgalactosaminyltransferase 7-like [Anneissia japonica]